MAETLSVQRLTPYEAVWLTVLISQPVAARDGELGLMVSRGQVTTEQAQRIRAVLATITC
jgi:hypothetical protein